jgi:predicted extracellular nuclease
MPIVKGMSGSIDLRAGVTRARTRALVWGMLTSLIAIVSAVPAAAQTVVISQVSGGGGASGAPYRRDFVEIHNVGQAAVSLDGLSIQYAPPAGLLTFGASPITPLSGVLPVGAYHLVEMAEGSTTQGGELPAPDDVGAVDLNFLSGKVALVRGIDALLCNGGAAPCDASSLDRIVDLIGYGSANFFEGPNGAAPAPPVTASLLRAGDGCTDTNDNLADFVVGTPQPRNHQSPAVICAAPPPPPPPPPPPACVPTNTIAEVQGNASLSPWLGATLAVSGVVTARLSTGPRPGFFVQMPTGDGDPTTSDAVFVMTGGDPPLEAMPGNAVCVEGDVTEFVSYDDPRARPLTELLASRVVLVQAGVPLPAPVTLTTADTPAGLGLDALERFEAMRVRVASLAVVAPTTGLVDPTTGTSASTGVFHGVIAGVARPVREPGVDVHDGPASDGPATVPIFDANLERLRVDTSALGLAPLDVAAGATATNVVGPLWYADRTYTVLPETTPAVTAVPAATALPAARTTEFTTAVLDADGLTDAESSIDYVDVAADPAAIARRLAKLSRHVRAVLQTPDVIGVQGVETLALLQALAARINADAVAAGQPDPRYDAYLVDGRDDHGLDTGVLVRTARVSGIDVRQELAGGLFIDPIMGDPYPLYARPPLVVRATVALSSGPLPVTVIVAHLRRATGMADPFLGVIPRLHRAAQVESLAALVQERQAAAPGEPLVVLADVDAPAFNDGYVDVTGTIAGVPVPATAAATATADLVDPNLDDALAGVDAASRYTSTVGGNAQQLLQVLVNVTAADLQSRAFIAHANADYPDSLRNDAGRAERAGSSDSPVAYFEVPGAAEPPPPPPPGPVEITPQVRVRVWRSHFFWHHRGVTYALVDVTNISGRTLNGPFQLGIYGLPAGATVVNAKGTVAGLPAVPVTWWRQLKPGRTMRAWVVLKGVPPGLSPKVRVFVGPAKK